MRHIKRKGGAYIELPHDPEPVEEFYNPSLFPMMYPTLFPYGVGGLEDRSRPKPISLKCHVKHYFSLNDTRFQRHNSFQFSAFNMLQRRSMLLHTSLKVKRANFASIANRFARVSSDAIHIVAERVSRGDHTTCNSEDERQALALMKEVHAVTTNVAGSSSSRSVMRNEIRGLMMDQGLPSFYLTINPADVYNPVVKFLSGEEIDLNNLLPGDVPDYRDQSVLVAKNSAVATHFFNLYMKAFIKCILAYTPEEFRLDEGVLGITKAYYGCVEAQGRGTLHCHMLVWVYGALDPNEIKSRIMEAGDEEFKTRLFSFLDDSLSNYIPDVPMECDSVLSDGFNASAVRGDDVGIMTDVPDALLAQRDLRNLVIDCQIHKHRKTCFKYCPPPLPKVCRFDLDVSNVNPETYFDYEKGEICLRCLDGLVNNFNATILRAVRCNMDIKFIGSGASAKAVLYYITDYITKSQLKTHVAYAALELSVKKLGEYDPNEDEVTVRAKRLLQRCAYSMLSHQELSGQQVSSYLLDFEDHFKSHEFQGLYWTSFEAYINAQCPSPECMPIKGSVPPLTDEPPVEEPPDIVQRGPKISDGGADDPQPIHELSDVDLSDDSDSDSDLSDDEDGVLESDHNAVQIEDGEDVVLGDEEIIVEVNASGQLVQRGSRVSDYVMRGAALKDLSLWEYTARVKKDRLINLYRPQKGDAGVERDGPLEEDADTNSPIESILDGDWTGVESMLNDRRRKRPKFKFDTDHTDHKTHFQMVTLPVDRRVLVPLGPGIPRRDRKDIYPRYCRLMLILFKPWSSSHDLREEGQSWVDAFKRFSESAGPSILKVLDNMQILHECQDSRDNHYAARRAKMANASPYGFGVGSRVEDDFGGDGDTEDALLHHLQSLDHAWSEKVLYSNKNVASCIAQAERLGMFNNRGKKCVRVTTDSSDAEMLVSDLANRMELVWDREYEARRAQSKLSSMEKDTPAAKSTKDPASTASKSVLNDGSAFREAFDSEMTYTPSIRQDIPAVNADQTVDVTGLINKWTLNSEQSKAFRIIAEHSLEKKRRPLRMFLGGQGGMGKSRVINALRDFFRKRNQKRRFRLALYTGIAARNISGMTLHAALLLNHHGRRGSDSDNQSKTSRDLVSMWQGIDYLFIDEVSMVGAKLLVQVSTALCLAKEDKTVFGGINIIFAGDFVQLPPVMDNKLFSRIDNRSGSDSALKVVQGRLLWLSVDTVVILTQVMHQEGAGNSVFVDLLSRLRLGQCTLEDHQVLRQRLAEKVEPDWSSKE